jgi:hypothetical protein
MGKGVIKTSGIPTSSSPGSAPGAGGTSPFPTNFNGPYIVGTIQDIQNPQLVVNFFQAYGLQMGLNVGEKVNYSTMTVNGQQLAGSVSLVERGEIMSIDSSDDGVGTLLDRATNTVIPFCQVNPVEMGLVAATPTSKGTRVNFEVVTDAKSGQQIAVALFVI